MSLTLKTDINFRTNSVNEPNVTFQYVEKVDSCLYLFNGTDWINYWMYSISHFWCHARGISIVFLKVGLQAVNRNRILRTKIYGVQYWHFEKHFNCGHYRDHLKWSNFYFKTHHLFCTNFFQKSSQRSQKPQ